MFAKNGERVLGFARLLLPKDKFPPGFPFNFKDPLNTGLPENYAFIGLISLIDPPRDTVPGAIEKCKTSGIKVIMVTGDQQLTAASIARKIGIIEDRSSIDIMEEEGCTYEEAVNKADAIVINGDMLTMAALEDDGLPESEKGKRLEKWLQKPQIVFARTSPAQKLYIVRGCQKLGYIVAVTGDGVNDSPAIKQADIGIAMGITGSDVAKDAAQMILLNDDFASIVIGVEEGRKIFDNLKKCITYMLVTNIPELIPFLLLILIGIPLACTTIQALLISVGTDLFPAAAFAYEKAEMDIMTRKPRNPSDHLVTLKLMTLAYAQFGFVGTFAGFICFFTTFNDFGFTPSFLFGVLRRPYFYHNPTDTFDPNHKFLGNTNLYCDGKYLKGYLTYDDTSSSVTDDKTYAVAYSLDWIYSKGNMQDLRMGYVTNRCETTGGVEIDHRWGECQIMQFSPVTRNPICYSTEAAKYAQSSYFYTVILAQFMNSLASKTRILPTCVQGIDNAMMFFGWVSEFVLIALLSYFRALNYVLNTRDLLFLQTLWYGAIVVLTMLIYDEIRRYLIRNFPKPKNKPNYFVRNALT